MTNESWIAHLARAVHGATAASEFMIFRSYMDETGINGARYCSIAGYISPVDEWERFERDWRFVLNEYMADMPEPERYFHALEFYENDTKYKKWTGSKRKSFETAIWRVIHDYKLALFLSAVDCRTFFSFTEDERRYLTGGVHNGMKWKTHGAPTKPYFLPFHFCLIQSAGFIRSGDKVFPVMSRQEQYRAKALELYDQMLTSDPPMESREKLADDIIFSDPKKVAALQAADLAVYWFGQLSNWRAAHGVSGSDAFPKRLQIVRLMKNVKSLDNLKLFDFNGLMLAVQGCNRYIKTSFLTMDQLLPSLPLPKRKEILGMMRKVDFRRFLDHETLTLRGDHD